MTRHKPTHTSAAFLCVILKTQDFSKHGQLQWCAWRPCTSPHHYSPAKVVSGHCCLQRVHLVIVPPIQLSFVMCRVLWSDKTDTEESLGRYKELQHIEHILQCPWQRITRKNKRYEQRITRKGIFFYQKWKNSRNRTLPTCSNPFLLWCLSDC